MSLKRNEHSKQIKIILAGLENAGKTSIITALNRKYDFQTAVKELKPTIRIEYSLTAFLGYSVWIWDMGGQRDYRLLYKIRADKYFDHTDLLYYVIDIQDKDRYDEALEYLSEILAYFRTNEIKTPVIVAFHKRDPQLQNEDTISRNATYLEFKIMARHPGSSIYFHNTSIFDIISIIRLISQGFSLIDSRFGNLAQLFETRNEKFGCKSLILFDANGLIIAEHHCDDMTLELYEHSLNSIREHIFLLKRMQEESYYGLRDFIRIDKNLISYIHEFELAGNIYFISVILREEQKECLLEHFADFFENVCAVLTKVST